MSFDKEILKNAITWPKIRDLMLEVVETFIVSFVVIYLIYRFVASMEVVSGPSMKPNFQTGERILVDKLSANFNPYQRGDIVVLIPPSEKTKHYLKRIIGVPGDVFKIFNCKVYISNKSGQFELSEPYLSPNVCTSGGMVIKDGRSLKLDNDQYIVMGDNRLESVDSRFFGVVTSKNILGKVVFRFWPPQTMGFL
jgi:signal peptidase I